MRIKRTLFVFITGVIVGSAATWFLLQEPEKRDELIEDAKQFFSEATEKVRQKAGNVAGEFLTDGNLAKTYSYGGYPVDVSYPGDLLILDNEGFIVGYDEIRKNPAWVAYQIFQIDNPISGDRPSRFKVDSRTAAQVSHNDYTGSGFDRGHMAPNYAIATRFGEDGQLETFFMSNIVPQTPELNQGPWRALEEQIAEYAQEFEAVWVLTGPLYDDEAEFIGPAIEVPDGFYKIVVDETEDGIRVLAFLFPQEVGRRANPERFLTSVDVLEEVTGFDFLSELDDETETRIEEYRASRLW